MKDFRVAIKTLECITVQAETAEAALDQVKKNIDPRVLGGQIEIKVLEENLQADTSSTQ